MSSALATPMIALTVGVPQAAAIMLRLLMAMDAAGLQQLWRNRDPALVRQLVPWGLVGIGLGAVLFGLLPARAVAGVLGVVTLLFLAQQLAFPIRRDGGPPEPPWVGRLCGTASGFTSFIAHAGGPPGRSPSRAGWMPTSASSASPMPMGGSPTRRRRARSCCGKPRRPAPSSGPVPHS